MTPVDFGLTADEAAKISGPVLVIPSAPPSRATRYRYYQTGLNHCQDDLKKILDAQRTSGATAPPPYCTTTPTAPVTQGRALILGY